MKQTIFLETPKSFDFRRTVLSHGWCDLLPFRIDQNNWILYGVIAAGRSIRIAITAGDGALNIEVTADDLKENGKEKIFRDIRHVVSALITICAKFLPSCPIRKNYDWDREAKSGSPAALRPAFSKILSKPSARQLYLGADQNYGQPNPRRKARGTLA